MRNLFIFFLLFTSCTKFGKNITIEGRVLNPITGEGIEGVKLKLLKSKVFALSGGYKEITEAITNSNGEFEVNKFRLRAEVLRAQDLNGDYYAIGWTSDNGLTFITQNSSDLVVTKGKKQKADLWAVPYGNLQINIKNISCFDSNDQLSIFRTHSISNFYDNVQNPAIYNGCIDQIGNMNKAPMGWYKFSGTVTKNNITLPIKDSIYLNSGETKIWNINY